jgi:hypothetical protein
MRTTPSLLVSVIAGAALSAAAAAPVVLGQDDIVWPRYVLVSKSYDTRLTCPQLQTEIDRVNSDLHMLMMAKLKAEQALRQAYDTQTSMGREQAGAFLNTGTAKVAFAYMDARDEIKESRRIAELRRDHLVQLIPLCKPPAR